MSTLTLLLLTVAPLEVRVLEQFKPVTATVVAKAASCDGKPAGSGTLSLSLADRRVRVGNVNCDLLVLEGPTAVRLDAFDSAQREYGRLSVTNEAERLRFITSLDVEDYLPSVVEAEASGLPAAALETQAVVSRTFALASRHRHEGNQYDVCDLAHCQVFRGTGEAGAAARAAVKKTSGQVLLVGGVVLRPAFFHSSCGGGTSTARDVFGDEGAGAAVKDATKDGPACRGAPQFEWEFEASRGELAAALGRSDTSGEGAFEVLRRDGSGRVLQLKSFGKRFTGSEFLSKVGRAFGWQKVRSLHVSATEVEGTVKFKGQGLGHGVGLCQHGARALAEQGATAAQLLSRYFPDCKVAQAP